MNQLGVSDTDKNHHPQRTQQHKHVLDIFGSNEEISLPVVPTENKLKNSGNNNNSPTDPRNNKLPLDYHKGYLLLASNLIKYDSNHAHEVALRENPPVDKKEKVQLEKFTRNVAEKEACSRTNPSSQRTT